MISLDNSIVVRFLTQDDVKQAQQATKLLSSLTSDKPGFICREVVVELVWVLEGSYNLSRSQISDALEGLLSAPELEIEEADWLGSILHLYEVKGFGFSDLIIRQASKRSGAQKLVTFDPKAAQLDGVELLGETTSL